jgi:uncharacterized protein RhaS with RHS repeats
LSFFALILRGVTTAQNPYESLGKVTPVLTLSNGKYQEFMTNDTIVQIGSVLFNTITNEVVSFLDEDSLRRMEADLTTRFLSVDPIGREYPELTPYKFASNTPIMAIDLDGLEAATPPQYNSKGVLETPAIDGIRIANHPSFLPKVKPVTNYPNQATIDVPEDEKFRNAVAKSNAEILKIALADPQKLREGDVLEWASILPWAKVSKVLKVTKLFKYSDEVKDLIHLTGKLDNSVKEVVTLLKEGQRTFGNAKKVVKDIIGDLGDEIVNGW